MENLLTILLTTQHFKKLIGILYVVCSNGFGHIKRSTSIAESLLQKRKDIQITWFISDSSAQYINDTASSELKSVSRKISYDNKIGFSLKNMQNPNFEDNFHKWLVLLKKTFKAQKNDLILSDNMLSPLNLSNNVILIGSFLWHDILEEDENNKAFLDFEKKIIEGRKPKMLHIKNMGMQAIIDKTEATPIPWVTTNFFDKGLGKTKNKNILITAGRSGVDRELFLEITKKLLSESQFNVFVNAQMKEELNDERLITFDFSDSSFANLSLIICRPGIGIITDAIRFNIPLLTHSRFLNKELIFNARKIKELGLGGQVDFSDFSQTNILIEKLIGETDFRKAVLDSIKQQPLNGADFAARKILEHI